MKTCSVHTCNRRHVSKGLCSSHYWRLQQGLPLDTPIRKHYKALSETCTLKGCRNRYYAKGYCQAHYRQWYANKPLTPLRQRATPIKKPVLPEWAMPLTTPEPCDCGRTAICQTRASIGKPDETYSGNRKKTVWLVMCEDCLQFERYVRREIPYSDLSTLLQEVA